MDEEISRRKNAAVGVFHSLDKVWRNKKLGVAHKMAVYNSCVLPHFTYACEAWHCTCAQLDVLEKAHRACLRQIMGVTLSDHHSTQHVLEVCGSEPLVLIIMKRVFWWLGHVERMTDGGYPKMVHGCNMDTRRPRGRPKVSLRHMHAALLKMAGEANPDEWLASMHERALDRESWRTMVNQLTFTRKPQVPAVRRSERIAALSRY